jgi:hypothetical protein
MQNLTLGGLLLIVAVGGWIAGKILKRLIYRSWIRGHSGARWYLVVAMIAVFLPFIAETTKIQEYCGFGRQLLALWLVSFTYLVSLVISKRPTKLEKIAIRVIDAYIEGDGERVRAALRKSLLMKNTVSVITSTDEYSVYIDSDLQEGQINQKGGITNFILSPKGSPEEWVEFK